MHAQCATEADGAPEVREAELESLQRRINKLKEQIGRFEAQQPARR